MQRGSGDITRRFGGLIAVVALLAIWELASLLLRSVALPSPLEVCVSLFKMGDTLLIHLLASALRVVYALSLALSLAVPLGLLSKEKQVDRLLSPIIYLLYPIPHIVLLPLIIMIFGIGEASKVFMIAMIVFFQILVTTRDASKSISEYYIYSLRSLGASKMDVYKHVIFPACLPKVMTALRISVGTSIAVLFFVESIATSKGLGYLILDCWSRMDFAAMYAAMLTMAALGFALYMTLEKVEKKLCRWVYL
ncbi:MAG: ABC-type nitrate/sulfonate/bicarbonate transport system [Candidatus Alkanophagales archaeon MCA70_species_1]|nr:ABC-type nitrate/sulfonate/bicarbonate transport system [Candidatus Alkanophaga volatiphilum]